MSDRPWLEEADPTLRAERELLKQLNQQQPPAGSVDKGWTALAAQIAVLPAVDPSALGSGSAHGVVQGAAQASGAAGAGLAAKMAAGIALAGGTLWGGAALLTPDAPPAPARSIPAQAAPAQPAPAVVSAAHAEQTAEAPAVDLPRPPTAPRPASSATTLAEEGRLLARAHQLVQAGQGQEALAVLRTSASRYPNSVLYQEREVLTIEALGATGAFGAAKARAERFLKRYPKSPHAGRLQRFVE
jgi:TolA-binding protein